MCFVDSENEHFNALILELAVYFATHIQAGGGVVEPPPKNFETANNLHVPFGMQLVHDLLISNNHHLISRCCHSNKTNNPRWSPMAAILDFRFLKFCLILRDFEGNS